MREKYFFKRQKFTLWFSFEYFRQYSN